MRLIQFAENGGARMGVRTGDDVVDLGFAAPDMPTDMLDLLTAGPAAMRAVAEAVAAAHESPRHKLSDLRLLPPVRRPGKILCLGLNYTDHAAEAGLAKPDNPVLFMRGASSLVAAGGAIVRPNCSDQLDYEGELVAVIGTTAKHVDRDRALDHVAGYAVFNDASIRDYQTIALLTECMTLDPGDLLVMGTPSGVGAVRKPPLWMKPGDVVEVEIEKIGLLRNEIVAEDAA